MKKFEIVMRILVVCWMAVIFMFSAEPAEESQELSDGVSYKIVSVVNSITGGEWDENKKEELAGNIDYPVRKAAHMSEYAVLALLTYGAVCTYESKKRYITAVATVFLYACTDEFHQLFVNGRAGRFTDVLIDTSGALIMLGIVFVISLAVSRHKKYN